MVSVNVILWHITVIITNNIVSLRYIIIKLTFAKTVVFVLCKEKEFFLRAEKVLSGNLLSMLLYYIF